MLHDEASRDVAHDRPSGDRYLLAGRIGAWRWYWALLGTVVSFALAIALMVAFEAIVQRIADRSGSDAATTPELVPGKISTFLDFMVLGVSLTLAGALSLKLIHRQPVAAALASDSRFDWSLFWRAAGAFLTVNLISAGYSALTEPGATRLVMRSLSDVPWIALGLGVILVQSFGEEFIFKGYLARVWGAVLPYRLLIVPLISVLFTALHLGNEDVSRDRTFNAIAFLAAELLTFAVFLRTQGLAAPTGLHWLNNVWSFCIVASVPGQSTALALASYTDPVLAAGGSHLWRWQSYAELGVGFALLLLLLTWRRSPFYLRPFPPGMPEGLQRRS
jgi:membrane protease YdiL (CAAX protease family)